MIKSLIFLSLLVLSLQIKNCVESITVCKSCKDGYTLAKTNNFYQIDCIKNELLGNANDNCLYYDNSEHTSCYECKNGFIKDNSNEPPTCKSSPHCTYMYNNKCSDCDHYYNLTEDGRCIESKCYRFNEGKCECESGFYPNENKECKQIPFSHCEEGNSTHCEECEEGYYLNGIKECKQIPFSHCKEGNSTHCEECERGYYLNGIKECKQIPIPHCLRGDANLCEKCEDRFYLKGDTECKELPIEHCEEGTDTYCDICESGYYAKGGKCLKKIEHCNTMDENDETKCDKCDKSYDLNDDRTACNYLCTSTEEFCDECNINYYTLDGKTCQVIDPDYKSEDIAKIISFDFAALSALLFLIL